jgi:hypothetical protein
LKRLGHLIENIEVFRYCFKVENRLASEEKRALFKKSWLSILGGKVATNFERKLIGILGGKLATIFNGKLVGIFGGKLATIFLNILG